MAYNVAIVLAAGQGKRMNSKVAKQFLELKGKPLVCYSLDAFEQSILIDEIILVTNSSALDLCRNIVETYHYKKVKKIIAGGKERYDSVYAGLNAVKHCDYVYIQDGARPFLTESLIDKLSQQVKESNACVAGMPVKDTIKIVDDMGNAVATPNRKTLWMIQTPQVFSFSLIKTSYDQMMQTQHFDITDDAMVVETYAKVKVKVVEASYRNIKITTPEDLITGENFLDAEKI